MWVVYFSLFCFFARFRLFDIAVTLTKPNHIKPFPLKNFWTSEVKRKQKLKTKTKTKKAIISISRRYNQSLGWCELHRIKLLRMRRAEINFQSLLRYNKNGAQTKSNKNSKMFFLYLKLNVVDLYFDLFCLCQHTTKSLSFILILLKKISHSDISISKLFVRCFFLSPIREKGDERTNRRKGFSFLSFFLFLSENWFLKSFESPSTSERTCCCSFQSKQLSLDLQTKKFLSRIKEGVASNCFCFNFKSRTLIFNVKLKFLLTHLIKFILLFQIKPESIRLSFLKHFNGMVIQTS